MIPTELALIITVIIYTQCYSNLPTFIKQISLRIRIYFNLKRPSLSTAEMCRVPTSQRKGVNNNNIDGCKKLLK